MRFLFGFWVLHNLYEAIRIGVLQMRFKSPSRSAHHGTYSPPTGRALTTARPESCRFGLFLVQPTRPCRCTTHFVTLHACIQKVSLAKGVCCGRCDNKERKKYSVYFEPINSSEQPENTSSGVSSILSKTYTAPFKNLHSHNVLGPVRPRTLQVPTCTNSPPSSLQTANIKHRK